MLISGRNFSDETIERIRSRVEEDADLTRTALSREVCGWLNWRSADGRLCDMSCRIALLMLSRRGFITLPPPRPVSFVRAPSSEPTTVRDWPAFEGSLAAIGKVWLEPVDSSQVELSRQWTEMLQIYHPLGAGPLCGAQIRYLIQSPRGVLGGLSFSAPAWHLAPRDRWIGWDDATRKRGLSKVVGNSRFLILPTVKVPNLASHVLHLALSRIARDWQMRYGITPVLAETFVDSTRYHGTCYRAANWTFLGQSQGRGRQDRRRSVIRIPVRKD